MPVPDAYKKIQAYDQIGRRLGEVIRDYLVREQRAFREMTEALRRVRNSRSEKSGVRRHDHRCSDAEHEMVQDEDAFVEAPWRQEQTGQTFLGAGNPGISTSPKRTSLSRRATDALDWN